MGCWVSGLGLQGQGQGLGPLVAASGFRVDDGTCGAIFAFGTP